MGGGGGGGGGVVGWGGGGAGWGGGGWGGGGGGGWGGVGGGGGHVSAHENGSGPCARKMVRLRGGGLEEIDDEDLLQGFRVIEFFSKALTPPQRVFWSMTRKEYYAAITALTKFEFIIQMAMERQFNLSLAVKPFLMDHRDLLSAAESFDDVIRRWSQRFDRFPFEVEFVPGDMNGVGDVFSRLCLASGKDDESTRRFVQYAWRKGEGYVPAGHGASGDASSDWGGMLACVLEGMLDGLRAGDEGATEIGRASCRERV